MVRAVWEGTASYQEEEHNTVGQHMHTAEFQHVDIQVATVWESRAMTEGEAYDVVIDGYLAEFHAEASDTQQLSELQDKVTNLPWHNSYVLKEKLACQWQNAKVTETAVPLAFLASDAILHGTRTRYDNNVPCANIQTIACIT